jgi:hypothetical protein
MIARDAGLLLVVAVMLPALWFETIGWRDLPDAPQTVYRSGVPHTGRTGVPRTDYAPGRSFLPIGLYHALSGDWHGRRYDLDEIAAAGFNTVHLWERQALADVAAVAHDAGVQIVFHEPDDDAVRRFGDHPAMLSWYLDEEPTLRYPADEQATRRAAFDARRDRLHLLDPGRPVHVVDAPPGNFVTWDAWAVRGDVVVFSVYPVRSGHEFRVAGPRSVADTVVRAVALNNAARPVWFVAQAFASPTYGWRLPTAREYRAMVYTAIVHGATGVIAFAFDSFVTRDGQVLGIAPQPAASYGAVPDYDGRGDAPLVVDDAALAASRSLWRDVARVNRELAELTPALLSPTAGLSYRVSVLGLSEVETPVRTLLKRDVESYVLIVVNLAGRALDARFAFDRAVVDLRRPFAPDAAVDPGDRGWQTRLGPFETQVFRFDLSKPEASGAEPPS